MATSTITGGVSVLYATKAVQEAALYSVGAKALFTKVPYGQQNYTLTPQDDIYQSIAARIGRPFTKKNFNVGPPVAMGGTSVEGEYNTTVNVSAVSPLLYSGNLDMAYPRYPASVLTLDVNLDLLRYSPARTTIHQVITEYNRVFGTKLPLADFDDGPIVQDGDTLLTAKDSSYWFIPGTQVSVGVVALSDRDLEIAGLNWPATKTLAAHKAYFVKDTFRVEFNKLFADTWTALQSTIPNESTVSTGFGTKRDRQITMTFNKGQGDVLKTIYFYRLDLGQLTAQYMATSTWDLWAGKILDTANVTRLAALAGIPFDAFELVNTDVVETTPRGSIYVDITAAPNSKFFTGTTRVKIDRAPHIADTIAPNTEFVF
ncbi:hypothetical protein D3C85_341560 [compost metagenome]